MNQSTLLKVKKRQEKYVIAQLPKVSYLIFYDSIHTTKSKETARKICYITTTQGKLSNFFMIQSTHRKVKKRQEKYVIAQLS